MKKFISPVLLIIYLLPTANCQLSSYWQQQVNYKIDVALNDKEHTLDGFEKLQYFNHSPDTLKFIWFHLWPNAYKNDKTAFSEQFLQTGRTDFYFSDKEDRGYINRLDFRVNDAAAKTEDHPNYIDVIKIVLPQPLAPGASAEITTPFHVKIPKNFSRGGHTSQSYQITQWYPKPAVYDRKGWHEMPYLDQGEFYSEFGNFEVKITLPENYAVAATGELQNEEEKNWLLNRSEYKTWDIKPKETNTKKPNPIFKKQESKNKNQKTKFNIQKPISSSPAEVLTKAEQKLKTLIYKQNNVHDFAWFADKRFIVKHDTIQLSSGRVIEAYAFYLPGNAGKWKNSISFIKKSVRTRSQWVGEYPYNAVSAVEANLGFDGGMEYPTITAMSPPDDEESLESLIEHEIGHNWFFAALGNNERAHPWMDEGINSYYDGRYDKEINKRDDGQADKERYLTILETERRDQPIETTSVSFTELNYDLVGYYKTNKWMQLLEKEMGREVFDKAMQEYYKRWLFKHPYPEDFKKVMEEVSGKNLDNIFSLLTKKGALPSSLKTKTGLTVLPASIKKLGTLFKTGNKTILLSPIAGVNTYDQLMIGAGITNYFPPNGNFRFLLAPMYSTGAKTLTGLGRLSYRWFPQKFLQQAELFVAASKFTTNNFTDDYKEKVNTGFTKFAPGFRLTFKEKNPASTIRKYIQWKTFLIKEDFFTFKSDTVITPGIPDNDTAVFNDAGKRNESRYLNQLKLVIENTRALYPYNAELQVEQGKGFVRAAFTGNYFFNYSKGGGANVRLFAGKFFYTGNKAVNPFSTFPYHFNMSGAKGDDDYTYSHYFIGRTEQLFWRGQQIAMRDGGFKVRTDLLSERVGRTDDWLVASNFTTTIPDNVNPLSVLPFKIPLRVFFDIGTNAGAWKKDAEGSKFLFDGGLQVSLFKNIVNIYVPLIYSKVYGDYFKSYKPETKFLRNISFSIDFQNIQVGKVIHNSIF